MADDADHLPPHRTLEHLADIVEGMAAAAGDDARLLAQLVETQHTYHTAVRALLTNTEIPPAPNPGEGGPVVLARSDAVPLVNAMGENVLASANAVADRGKARANELGAVTAKEREEKQNPKPGTSTGGAGGSAPGSGSGSQGKPGSPAPPGADGGQSTDAGAGGGVPPTKPTPPSPQPPPPAGQPPPSVPGKPTQPAPLTAKGPPPTVVLKKTTPRKCYTFWVYNSSTKPATDLHLRANGLSSPLASGPVGWSGGNASDGKGVGWAAGSGGQPLPPGKPGGPFTICLDGDAPPPVNDVLLTHADNTASRVKPNEVLVKRGRELVSAPPGPTGVPSLTPTGRSYVHEVQITTGGGGRSQIDIAAQGVRLPTEVTSTLVDGVSVAIGNNAITIRPADANTVELPAGKTVTVRVETDSAYPSFTARGG